MSNAVGVNEALERLGQLRQAVRDAAARRDTLEREHQARVHREQYDTAAVLRDLDAAHAARVAEIESTARLQSAAIETRACARQTRIHRARTQALNQALAVIAADEGARKFRIQQRLLQASRTHDAVLPGVKLDNEEFNKSLASAGVELDQLAARAEASFRPFGRVFAGTDAESPTPPTAPDDERLLLDQTHEERSEAASDLESFRAKPLPALFRLLPVPVLATLIVVGHGAFAAYLHFKLARPVPSGPIGGSLLGSLLVMAALFFLGRMQARPAAAATGAALGRARCSHALSAAAAARNQIQRVQDIELAFARTEEQLNSEWNQLMEELEHRRADAQSTAERKMAHALERCSLLARRREHETAAFHSGELERFQTAGSQQRAELAAASEARLAQFAREFSEQAAMIQLELDAGAMPVYAAIQAAGGFTQAEAPWRSEPGAGWSPPRVFSHVAPFGRLDVDVAVLAGVPLQPGRLALPGAARLSLPALLAFPANGSILFETMQGGRFESIAALNNIVLHLLAGAPPGRVSFSFVDPVGLGQNFAGVTHLSDFGETLVTGRICTQPAQIEKRLAELNEHMEKVIQMYLRNEYATIADYNEKAGTIAEKYHFLVIADFPVNFSEAAIKRLLSVAANGPRCGVFVLMHWDRRQPLVDVTAEDLRDLNVCVTAKGGEMVLAGRTSDGVKLVLEPAPDAARVTQFIQRVGELSLSASRVEVPFDHIAPAADATWSLDTGDELRVPIGRTGATKFQYLELGQGTRQHALVAGKTGSGKSTLFHVIITNLALWCSPEQVEFYLVDFKKGVEFQCYAANRLPHARVVAIESDREFGLSVLQRLDEELRRRGELFRRAGAQDVRGYRRSAGAGTMPRSLLLIDEFQEFFTEDDRIAQSAALLLDRIVRQGRAFGIHVVLGSQTLGGAYTLARATLGQMVVRVALQCNEADAYLIMDENNPAPRLLTRPGEGIYNDMAGAIEGNSPFQAVWLDDEVRDARLKRVRELARQRPGGAASPVVFEGNAPADVRDNELLAAAIATRPPAAPAAARVWLGAPNSIKGPTEVTFARQSGCNLLVVGQRDEAAQAIVTVALLALAAQFPRDAARFVILDASAPGSPERAQLEDVCRALTHEIVVARGPETETALAALAEELKSRSESGDAGRPDVFLFIHGIQRFKKLRFEEDFGFGGEGAANPGQQLFALICEGPATGIHVIGVCDTCNNVNRFLSRKALSEFELRVLFQMSANDSAALCDSQRAASLGLHRAVFFSEQEGYLEVFRPYAAPDATWIAEAARQLGSE
ncbi:MAG: ATP-binding protein [Verrucomicrobia bacterium]|nr:ATP-binding protein [Verrucomicrobiota bacterium]